MGAMHATPYNILIAYLVLGATVYSSLLPIHSKVFGYVNDVGVLPLSNMRVVSHPIFGTAANVSEVSG